MKYSSQITDSAQRHVKLTNTPRIFQNIPITLMSLKVRCNNHNLSLVIPQTEQEHVELVSQVTLLLDHLKENPDCRFKEMRN